jgi:hypothetical protein
MQQAGPPKGSLFTRAGMAPALQQARSFSTQNYYQQFSVGFFVALVVVKLFGMRAPFTSVKALIYRKKSSIYTYILKISIESTKHWARAARSPIISKISIESTKHWARAARSPMRHS